MVLRLINMECLRKIFVKMKGLVLLLSLLMFVYCAQAQKKKRLSSGAFSSYDKIFSGDVIEFENERFLIRFENPGQVAEPGERS